VRFAVVSFACGELGARRVGVAFEQRWCDCESCQSWKKIVQRRKTVTTLSNTRSHSLTLELSSLSSECRGDTLSTLTCECTFLIQRSRDTCRTARLSTHVTLTHYHALCTHAHRHLKPPPPPSFTAVAFISMQHSPKPTTSRATHAHPPPHLRVTIQQTSAGARGERQALDQSN
jgi:hypothetical protein